MRIEFLNVWGGKTGVVLRKYLNERTTITDVFCFQEADKDFPNIAGMAIRGFNKFEADKYVNKDNFFHQATYVKKGIRVDVSWPVLKEIPEVGLGFVTEIATRWGVYTIVNFHGISRPGDKLDTENRLEQSRRLIECFKGTTKLIIGGDFNLGNNTRCVDMFADAGFDNLITRFGITNTRNENIWSKYPDNRQYYSDWVFTRGVSVCGFRVPYNLVSDHLPMQLEIE